MTDSRQQSPDTIASDALACRLFRVRGHVQGVFFRASTQTAARDLGLSGYAINCKDGSVEVLACGSAQSLQRLESWLHDGPPMAQVSEVSADTRPFEERDDFTTG